MASTWLSIGLSCKFIVSEFSLIKVANLMEHCRWNVGLIDIVFNLATAACILVVPCQFSGVLIVFSGQKLLMDGTHPPYFLQYATHLHEQVVDFL